MGSITFEPRVGRWRVRGREVTAAEPFRLAPGKTESVHVYDDISDCRAVPASPQPILMRVKRLVGEQSVKITLGPSRRGEVHLDASRRMGRVRRILTGRHNIGWPPGRPALMVHIADAVAGVPPPVPSRPDGQGSG
jgi:hypothetical protein